MNRQFVTNTAAEAIALASSKILARRKQRYDQYRSNSPREDQAYPVAGALHSLPVRVDEAFEIPNGDAVFLSLDLRANGLGRVRDPYVELVASNGHRVKQYVERDTNAKRYINASALAGNQATLSLSDLSLATRDATWLVSTSRELGSPLLVVAPHPDDAELSSFGLYSGRSSWVVTVSAGELGTHDYGGLFTRDASGATLRGQTRVAESLSAPVAGGVSPERCANLGYFDNTLSQLWANRDEAGRSMVADMADLAFFRRSGAALPLPKAERATWDSLVSDIEACIRLSNASCVTFPHPVLDEHRDHACVGLATIEALLRVERPLTALAYAVHGPGGANGANLHPVGARDGVVSLQPGAYSEPLFDGVLSVNLSDEQQRRKALALDTYRDLKDADGPLPVENAFLRAKRGLREAYRAYMVYDVGLVRRFVRPTEIFYRLEHERLGHWQRVFHAAFARRLA